MDRMANGCMCNKIFDFKLEDGAFPKEATILDDAGNIDEKQLEEASQRNIDKKNPPKKEPVKKKTLLLKSLVQVANTILPDNIFRLSLPLKKIVWLYKQELSDCRM